MEIRHLLKELKYIIGQVRIPVSYNSSIQWITSPFIDQDIIVYDLCHAFNGNFVIVSLDDQQYWEDVKDSTFVRNTDSFERSISLYSREIGEVTPDLKMISTKKRPTGQIVKIIERSPVKLLSRLFVNPNIPDVDIHNYRIPESLFKKATDNQYIAFKPVDERYPHVYIERKGIDRGFMNCVTDHYLEIELDTRWPKNQKHPGGKIQGILGKIGDICAEHIVILNNLGLPLKCPEDVIIEPAVFEGLKPYDESRVPGAKAFIQDDGVIRHDVRDLDGMISIDPETAKDLDDALSVRKLDDGNILIGVHIADVSHFVKPETDIDHEAMKRQTSVYLIGNCIPMLPKILSEKLCSLNPGETKYTFSCYWTVDYDRTMNEKKLITIGEPFFAKTINRSICRLSYSQAFDIMNSKDNDASWTGLVAIENKNRVRESLDILKNVHRCIRASRPLWVDLSREGSGLRFFVDEMGKINRIDSYPITEANKMIETFMVEANIEAGRQQIRKNSVLRNHTGFNDRRAKNLEKLLSEIGIDVSLKTKRSFVESLARLAPNIRQKVTSVATYALDSAKYMVLSDDEMDTSHHGLDIPIYTHFTSPIRRYVDILVHRNLEYLCKEEIDDVDIDDANIDDANINDVDIDDDIESIIVLANEQKSKAKKASRLSQVLHLNMYLKSLPTPIRTTGIIANYQVRGKYLVIQLSVDDIQISMDDILIPIYDSGTKSKQPNIEYAKVDNSKIFIYWKNSSVTEVKILSTFSIEISYCCSCPPTTKVILLN